MGAATGRRAPWILTLGLALAACGDDGTRTVTSGDDSSGGPAGTSSTGDAQTSTG